MKSFIRRSLCVIGVVILGGVLWLSYQLSHPPSLLPYAEHTLGPVNPASTRLRATFLGVSTVLLDDGETAILTDGFFSRPSKGSVFSGKIAPDVEVIAKSLQRLGAKRLAAVIVTHSHYDHVMDASEVARRTGALVVGSESTANVARGWGLPADRIRVVHDGETLRLGRFQLTFLRSQHAPTFLTGGTIDEVLVPPVWANRYREGTCYSVLIEHEGRSLLVHGSAGFVDSALKGQHAEVVFLGIGTLGVQDGGYRQSYWNEVVRSVGAKRVIPIHWDDFFLPLDQPMQPLPRPFDDVEVSLAFLFAAGERDGVDVRLSPVWTVIDPFAGLE